VHTYTLGCAIWTTLVGVRLHPLGLQCTCSRFDTIPACDRQTDGQTDGIAVASTALAMRALRRADKAGKTRSVNEVEKQPT